MEMTRIAECLARAQRRRMIRPCLECGEECGAQWEFIVSNDGYPWPYCSGCDPALREDEDEEEA